MRISKLLRIVLITVIIVLLADAVALNRDYQDSWVLEGLEIPFIVFVVIYLTYSFFEDKLFWVIIFALVARFVFLIIPNLKYTWFQGVNFDQQYHFRMIQDIYNTGHVPAVYSYSGTPGMHILFGAFSITTGSSVVFTFKYLPVMCWVFFPLITYCIVRLVTPRKPLLVKYAVLVSSIPVEPTLSLLLVGATFGTLFAILFFSHFTRALILKARGYACLAVISAFVLVSSHSYSMTILVAGLVMAYLASKSEFVKDKLRIPKFGRLHSDFLLLLIVLAAAWLMFVASTNFQIASTMLESWSNAILGAKPTGQSFTDINYSFFGLTLTNQLRVITVYYGGTLLLLLLGFLGILVARRVFRSSRILNFTSAAILSVWLLFVLQIALTGTRAGLFEYGRLFDFSYIFAPIFVGVLLYYVHERLHSSKLNFFLCLLLIALATLEVYGCQPLLPIASSVRSGLPSDEYIVYVGEVNSIYQRSMVSYTYDYVRTGMIACDYTTMQQILGMTDYNYSQTHLWGYYPFDPKAQRRLEAGNFDYFLIHILGKSGWLAVSPETETQNFVVSAVNNSSVIYSNGQSFVLTKPFSFYQGPG
jgi:hypothetical protein